MPEEITGSLTVDGLRYSCRVLPRDPAAGRGPATGIAYLPPPGRIHP
jgi:hypothetical protein